MPELPAGHYHEGYPLRKSSGPFLHLLDIAIPIFATMIDIAYVLLTVAFFAVMVAYVRGCERLGKDDPEDRSEH